MTGNEQRLARALNCCTFAPGIGTKRFARDMAFIADHHPDKELTPKQREYLRSAVVRFAKQIDPELVALAFMPDMLRTEPTRCVLTRQHWDREHPE